MYKSILILIILSFFGCSGLEDSEKKKIRKRNATGEYIYRCHDEFLYPLAKPIHRERENYPWESPCIGKYPKITKDFFRCQGNSNHPSLTYMNKGQWVKTYDCGGAQQHSLPLKNGKEFIYPTLIELLNYIQEKTLKKVVITCGHRCPAHNTYSDPSQFNTTSKHMMGAEVKFYVKGLEWNPEIVIGLIQSYYRDHPKFKQDAQFRFHRYEKETNVSTFPWYNKEIFVKLFQKDEGRDFDHQHPFPFISIQLKWDRETDEPVTYQWSQAFNGFLRY